MSDSGFIPHIPAPKKVTQAHSPDITRAMMMFIMIVAVFYFGKDVLLPITMALFLAFLLAPLVSLLRKIYLPRVAAVLLAIVIAVTTILGIGGVIGSQLSDLSTNMPEYTATIESKVSMVREFTLGRVTDFANHIGVQPASVGVTMGIQPNNSKTKIPHMPPPSASQPAAAPLELAQRYLSPVLSPIGTLGIVLIVAIFALLQQEDLRDRLIRLAGSNDLHRTTLAIDDAAERLSRYFVTQLGINTVFGVVIGLGLLIIGVPNPVLFGILSALLRFVPYIGSLISALLPLSLAAAVDPGWSLTIYTGCLYLIVEGITGQFIEPMTYGHSTGLSPFSVIVAALFWSWLWGPIGLILSTPLTLCLVVIGRHVKKLEFLDIMLGDRPALTPIESLYQRIFAGDADESLDHAERMLKDVSLTTYYNEVVLKALHLADDDARRGALDPEQILRVKTTVTTIINGLKDYDDKKPQAVPELDSAVKQADDTFQIPNSPQPPHVDTSSNNTVVMCISGRGALDESASAILGQLLAKHGMTAKLLPYEAVSRENIASLDITGVNVVCISCLDITGSPAHLRYMIQRLRELLPKGATILIALASTNYQQEDPATRAHLGANHISCSAGETISLCAAAVRAAGEHLAISAT